MGRAQNVLDGARDVLLGDGYTLCILPKHSDDQSEYLQGHYSRAVDLVVRSYQGVQKQVARAAVYSKANSTGGNYPTVRTAVLLGGAPEEILGCACIAALKNNSLLIMYNACDRQALHLQPIVLLGTAKAARDHAGKEFILALVQPGEADIFTNLGFKSLQARNRTLLSLLQSRFPELANACQQAELFKGKATGLWLLETQVADQRLQALLQQLEVPGGGARGSAAGTAAGPSADNATAAAAVDGVPFGNSPSAPTGLPPAAPGTRGRGVRRGGGGPGRGGRGSGRGGSGLLQEVRLSAVPGVPGRGAGGVPGQGAAATAAGTSAASGGDSGGGWAHDASVSRSMSGNGAAPSAAATGAATAQVVAGAQMDSGDGGMGSGASLEPGPGGGDGRGGHAGGSGHGGGNVDDFGGDMDGSRIGDGLPGGAAPAQEPGCATGAAPVNDDESDDVVECLSEGESEGESGGTGGPGFANLDPMAVPMAGGSAGAAGSGFAVSSRVTPGSESADDDSSDGDDSVSTGSTVGSSGVDSSSSDGEDDDSGDGGDEASGGQDSAGRGGARGGAADVGVHNAGGSAHEAAGDRPAAANTAAAPAAAPVGCQHGGWAAGPAAVAPGPCTDAAAGLAMALSPSHADSGGEIGDPQQHQPVPPQQQHQQPTSQPQPQPQPSAQPQSSVQPQPPQDYQAQRQSSQQESEQQSDEQQQPVQLLQGNVLQLEHQQRPQLPQLPSGQGKLHPHGQPPRGQQQQQRLHAQQRQQTWGAAGLEKPAGGKPERALVYYLGGAAAAAATAPGLGPELGCQTRALKRARFAPSAAERPEQGTAAPAGDAAASAAPATRAGARATGTAASGGCAGQRQRPTLLQQTSKIFKYRPPPPREENLLPGHMACRMVGRKGFFGMRLPRLPPPGGQEPVAPHSRTASPRHDCANASAGASSAAATGLASSAAGGGGGGAADGCQESPAARSRRLGGELTSFMFDLADWANVVDEQSIVEVMSLARRAMVQRAGGALSQQQPQPQPQPHHGSHGATAPGSAILRHPAAMQCDTMLHDTPDDAVLPAPSGLPPDGPGRALPATARPVVHTSPSNHAASAQRSVRERTRLARQAGIVAEAEAAAGVAAPVAEAAGPGIPFCGSPRATGAESAARAAIVLAAAVPPAAAGPVAGAAAPEAPAGSLNDRKRPRDSAEDADDGAPWRPTLAAPKAMAGGLRGGSGTGPTTAAAAQPQDDSPCREALAGQSKPPPDADGGPSGAPAGTSVTGTAAAAAESRGGRAPRAAALAAERLWRSLDPPDTASPPKRPRNDREAPLLLPTGPSLAAAAAASPRHAAAVTRSPGAQAAAAAAHGAAAAACPPPLPVAAQAPAAVELMLPPWGSSSSRVVGSPCAAGARPPQPPWSQVDLLRSPQRPPSQQPRPQGPRQRQHVAPNRPGLAAGACGGGRRTPPVLRTKELSLAAAGDGGIGPAALPRPLELRPPLTVPIDQWTGLAYRVLAYLQEQPSGLWISRPCILDMLAATAASEKATRRPQRHGVIWPRRRPPPPPPAADAAEVAAAAEQETTPGTCLLGNDGAATGPGLAAAPAAHRQQQPAQLLPAGVPVAEDEPSACGEARVTAAAAAVAAPEAVGDGGPDDGGVDSGAGGAAAAAAVADGGDAGCGAGGGAGVVMSLWQRRHLLKQLSNTVFPNGVVLQQVHDVRYTAHYFRVRPPPDHESDDSDGGDAKADAPGPLRGDNPWVGNVGCGDSGGDGGSRHEHACAGAASLPLSAFAVQAPEPWMSETAVAAATVAADLQPQPVPRDVAAAATAPPPLPPLSPHGLGSGLLEPLASTGRIMSSRASCAAAATGVPAARPPVGVGVLGLPAVAAAAAAPPPVSARLGATPMAMDRTNGLWYLAEVVGVDEAAGSDRVQLVFRGFNEPPFWEDATSPTLWWSTGEEIEWLNVRRHEGSWVPKPWMEPYRELGPAEVEQAILWAATSALASRNRKGPRRRNRGAGSSAGGSADGGSATPPPPVELPPQAPATAAAAGAAAPPQPAAASVQPLCDGRAQGEGGATAATAPWPVDVPPAAALGIAETQPLAAVDTAQDESGDVTRSPPQSASATVGGGGGFDLAGWIGQALLAALAYRRLCEAGAVALTAVLLDHSSAEGGGAAAAARRGSSRKRRLSAAAMAAADDAAAATGFEDGAGGAWLSPIADDVEDSLPVLAQGADVFGAVGTEPWDPALPPLLAAAPGTEELEVEGMEDAEALGSDMNELELGVAVVLQA